MREHVRMPAAGVLAPGGPLLLPGSACLDSMCTSDELLHCGASGSLPGQYSGMQRQHRCTRSSKRAHAHAGSSAAGRLSIVGCCRGPDVAVT